MTSPNQRNVYTNPAFCQQSEFFSSPQQRCVSPQRTRAVSAQQRQPPVGALNPCRSDTFKETKVLTPPVPGPKPIYYKRHDEEEHCEEIYEEMLVDDSGFVATKQFTNVNGNRYDVDAQRVRVNYPQNDYNVNGYETDDCDKRTQRVQKHRYEYIPMQEHERNPPQRRPPVEQVQEVVEVAPGRVHRYAVIPPEQETQFVTTNKGRYALVPVEEVPPAVQNRYAVISQQELLKQQHHHQQQQQQQHRYEYIPEQTVVDVNRPVSTVVSPPTPRKSNPVATQKLHELLSTPRKTPQRTGQTVTPQKALSPHSPRRAVSPIYQPDPFCTPNKNVQLPRRTSPRNSTPKAQQKLNYTLSTRQQQQHIEYENKRHTAVIAPICSSPVQSVYSETTFSNKTESWMNLSMSKPPIQVTMAVAAFMMMMCGALTSGLSFYMIYIMGRLYFLDFGVVSGFTCFVLGCLGFRSRACYWLPHRNYISGYIVLSCFSLMTCVALLLLLFMQPKPGSPWADVTSGAVCGISGLSLLLATSGVIASYCCKYPPPDNRVQHCARGFTV